MRGVELVVSDDHEGLKAAVNRHFQGAGWQRCQVHYAKKPPRDGRGQEAKKGARSRSARGLRRAGQALLPSISGLLRGREVAREGLYEKVAEHLEEHVEEYLSCLAFPESHRKRIRTTNGLENVSTRR
ncbi:transposase [Rubrobacter xylanophilus]|uniref:transposase n=1 Tax=Rubrobacter xylanophilus TaxID=49319 RepID=UPI0038CD95F8